MRILLAGTVFIALVAARPLFAQNSPLDKAQEMAGSSGLTLDGDWTNVDPTSSGVIRVMISGKKLHVWGACHPKACDWGTAKGQPFSSTVDRHDIAALLVSQATTYNTGVMTISLETDGRLRIQRFAHYSDGRRSDTSFVDYFTLVTH